MQANKKSAVANTRRGEISGMIDDLEVVLVPTFERISRAEGALGKSCYAIANSMGNGSGLTVLETAVFLEQLTKPRLERKEIGNAIMSGGLTEAMILVGLVCEKVLMGDKSAPDKVGNDISLETEELEDEGND